VNTWVKNEPRYALRNQVFTFAGIRKGKAVQACTLSKPVEFDGIKTGIVQALPRLVPILKLADW
jgi:hypothetical protein